MGVVGWTEEQTLQSTIEAITLAYDGRCEFVRDILHSVFGKAEPDDPVPFSFELFDSALGV